MKEFIKKAFKDRTIGFYIGLGAAAVAFITGIVFIIIRAVDADEAFFLKSNDAFLFTTIILLIVGALSQGLVVFTDFKFAPMIPVVFYSLALGSYAYCAMFQLADLFTGISFFGGSVGFAITFLVIFALCGIAAIYACFTDQKQLDAE